MDKMPANVLFPNATEGSKASVRAFLSDPAMKITFGKGRKNVDKVFFDIFHGVSPRVVVHKQLGLILTTASAAELQDACDSVPTFGRSSTTRAPSGTSAARVAGSSVAGLCV